MKSLSATQRTGLIILLLVGSIVAVYWPLWNAQFLNVDDLTYVVNNPHVCTGLTRSNIVWAFTHTWESNYHPLTWLSHMLDCSVFGVLPRWAHVENVLLHIANTILVFILLLKVTARRGCSAFVAGIFAIHPLHVESVAWVAERKDVLSTLFWLLTTLAYVHYVERKSWARYGAVAVLFLLSLMSKPIAVTLPCTLLLLDLWPLRRIGWLAPGEPTAPRWSDWLPLLREKIPFFAMSGIWCVVTYLAQSAGGAVVSVDRMPIGTRIGNATVSYVRYVAHFLWPEHLSAYYPFPSFWTKWQIAGAALLLVGMALLVLLNTRRRPYLAFGWLWFMGTLVPMIGLVQVGPASMADRYMYVPILGLAVMLAWGGSELLSRLRWKREWVVALGGSAALLSCALVTAGDVPAWRDSRTLYTRVIERTGPSVFGCYVLGGTLLRERDYPGAARVYAQCTQLMPHDPHTHRALASALRAMKKYDRAESELSIALRLNPADAETWVALGALDIERHKWQRARKRLERAVALDPNSADGWMNLAVAHHALMQPDKVQTDLDHALALNAALPMAWYMRGLVLLENGKAQTASQAFARALKLQPNEPDFLYHLGLAMMESGHGRAAIDPLMSAIALRPNDPQSLAHLAWLLATHPDQRLRRGEDAMFFATRAAELTEDQSPDTLDALAAAQAEQHDFANAAQTAEHAEKIAREKGNTAQADKIATRAARYRAGQPVRDTTLAGADGSELMP